jgi:hypothetical protein
VKQDLYPLLLENDKATAYLDFETNTNLTLRNILKDDQLFIRLVEEVVRINESNEAMSIMLLDKVNKHEDVIKYMIKMQMAEIERKRPEYFVGVGMGREDFMNHIQE